MLPEQIPRRRPNSRVRTLTWPIVMLATLLGPSTAAQGGFNIDFGSTHGLPSPTFAGASTQAGEWNLGWLGSTALVDVSGNPGGTMVSAEAFGQRGFFGFPSLEDAEILLNDNIWGSDGSNWSVEFTGLPASSYELFIYAPSNPVIPTGEMNVSGLAVPSMEGDLSANLVEGLSWMRIPISATQQGAFLITGMGPDYTGLAGIQLIPISAHPVSSYCTAGTSANGCTASLSTAGLPSASQRTGFAVQSSGMDGNRQGIFFQGTNGRQAQTWGNGSSYQCVTPPTTRLTTLNSRGSIGTCDGSMSLDVNALWDAKPSKNPGAGALVQLQLWYRDPLNTSNQTTSLSDAIEVLVAP